MADIIGTALILHETEIAALVGSGKEDSVFGFELSDEAVSIEGRMKGINSLLRRGLLCVSGENYSLCGEFAEMLKCVMSPEQWFVAEQMNALIGCRDKSRVLIRAVSSEERRFSVMAVDEYSLTDILSDESLLLENDEDSIMERDLPNEKALREMLENEENMLCCIRSRDDRLMLTVLQAGLCSIAAAVSSGKYICRLYSRDCFIEMLGELFEGEVTENDNH